MDKKLIFLVEDDDDNAELILDYFEDAYEFRVFNSSVEAWGLIQSPETRIPDIFLLDIGLPTMDGVELLKNIREKSRMSDVAAIALTAHAMGDDRSRFMKAGFNGYVSKPIVDFEYLESLIEDLSQTPS